MIFHWCSVWFGFQTLFNEWIWQKLEKNHRGSLEVEFLKWWAVLTRFQQTSTISTKKMGGSLLSWTHAYLYLHSLYIHAVWFDSHSTDTIFISLRTKCAHGKFCKVLKSQDLNKSNLERPLGCLAVEVFFSIPHPLWMSCNFFIDSRVFSAILWDQSFPSAFFLHPI